MARHIAPAMSLNDDSLDTSCLANMRVHSAARRVDSWQHCWRIKRVRVQQGREQCQEVGETQASA